MTSFDSTARSDGSASGAGAPALRVVSPGGTPRGARSQRGAILRLGAYVLVFAAGVAAMFAYQSVGQRPVERHDGTDAVASPPQRTIVEPAVAIPESSLPPATFAAAPQPLASLDPIELARSDNPPAVETVAATVPEIRNEPIPAAQPSGELRVAGVTEPAPGRFARLSLATSQAVAFVDVKPGDRVKKGWQVFSHWESPDRLQAEKIDLEKMKKLLEVTRSQADAAQQTATRLRRLKGDVSAQEQQDVDLTARIRQQELEAEELSLSEAESRFAAMEFEFKQAFVTSPIDGRVASVDVVLGERRQLGGAFRGVTVLDTRVLYCRCLLNPEQLAWVSRSHEEGSSTSASAGDAKASRKPIDKSSPRLLVVVESAGQQWAASIATIGIQADAATGLIPLFVEVQNPNETLRSGVRVEVVLTEAESASTP